MRRKLPVVFAGVATLLLLQMVLDLRVLVAETKVQPGQKYVLEEWGDLGKNTQASLVCRYFTGRSVRTHVFWYAPNNMFGRDQCPFVMRGD